MKDYMLGLAACLSLKNNTLNTKDENALKIFAEQYQEYLSGKVLAAFVATLDDETLGEC